MKTKYLSFIITLSIASGHAQNQQQIYAQFQNSVSSNYSSFRDNCNKKYAEFLRTAWDWYEGKAPMPMPKDKNPVPPKLFEKNRDEQPIVVKPIDINPIEDTPQPKPVEPVNEVPTQDDNYYTIKFFGNICRIRFPKIADLKLPDTSPRSIANGWENLCDYEMNNTIRDCLETRIRYKLCDWAYLLFLDELSRQYCPDSNGATLLMAFLYCQSGYQMRLSVDGSKLLMLYGSKHQIYNKVYFAINGINFYPYGEPSKSISICKAEFDGETPMSLLISSEQLLGGTLSQERHIASKKYSDVYASSQTPLNLIEFFNGYPSSSIGSNPMTRWAMYANTPLSQSSKDAIYPSLKKAINGRSKAEAANKILDWVQTGFVYEYDDKVWGHDRAFFAEETLYYPYCDCEDRSILFSRLIRDLLNLDVALIYYPGHLATAVCFNEDINGDAMMIDGRKFIVCDPTYIGAPVGAQMPDLDYSQTQAIILNR